MQRFGWPPHHRVDSSHLHFTFLLYPRLRIHRRVLVHPCQWNSLLVPSFSLPSFSSRGLAGVQKEKKSRLVAALLFFSVFFLIFFYASFSFLSASSWSSFSFRCHLLLSASAPSSSLAWVTVGGPVNDGAEFRVKKPADLPQRLRWSSYSFFASIRFVSFANRPTQKPSRKPIEPHTMKSPKKPMKSQIQTILARWSSIKSKSSLIKPIKS